MFSRYCLLCGRLLWSGRWCVCQVCDLALPRMLRSQQCHRCGLAAQRGHRLCDGCVVGRSMPFRRLYAAFRYEGILQPAVHRAKYQGYYPLWAWLIERWLVYLQSCELPAYDGILFVPMHPLKLMNRDFDQARVMAESASKALDLPLLSCCRRHWWGWQRQSLLSAADRRRNVRSLYRIDQSLAGLRVLLVDDIVTTASTVTAIAKCCREMGAYAVDVACLARRALQPCEKSCGKLRGKS